MSVDEKVVQIDENLSLEDRLVRAGLPSPATQRWVCGRKAKLVAALNQGRFSENELCEVYSISHEELDHWCLTYRAYGLKALRATRVQDYRHKPKGLLISVSPAELSNG